MKNIVSMIGTLPPTKGNAYYCMGLAREMSQKIKVDFIAFKKLYPDFLYPGGVDDEDRKFIVQETETLSIQRIITYYNPISWIRAGLTARASIVHLQFWSIPITPIYMVILLVLKLRKKKIVFTVHNVMPHESSPIDRFLTKMVLRFGDAFIIHSNSNRENLLQHFQLADKVVHEVHMPVHDMYLGEHQERQQARKEIGLPPNSKVVLSFGNLREYKGIDHLIMALSNIVRDVPTIHLLIVGQLWVKWERYQKIITHYGLDDRVSTVFEYVHMSDVQKYFVASDLVVLPYKHFSAQSGVGNVALAFGLPIVVTRVGGLPDLVRDERAVVPAGDVSSLSGAIRRILLNQELYEKLCDDTNVLRQQYSWSTAIESTLSIYRHMLGEK